MNRKTMWWVLGFCSAVVIAAAVVCLVETTGVTLTAEVASSAMPTAGEKKNARTVVIDSVDNEGEAETEADESSEPEEPMTEEERSEAEAEAKVEAFDNLTDKWMEPTKTGVPSKDADKFLETFRQVPDERKDECIHRALNLIPDENVMLLVGVLMDSSMDREIVETVFNDVLNRDESVKMPIMKAIFKNKKHPCWADVAWILDVTGENPTQYSQDETGGRQ